MLSHKGNFLGTLKGAQYFRTWSRLQHFNRCRRRVITTWWEVAWSIASWRPSWKSFYGAWADPSFGFVRPPRRSRRKAPLDVSRFFPLVPPPSPLRGGAAGAAATTRRRNEKNQFEQKLLEGLQALLASAQQDVSNKGKGKGKGKVGKPSPGNTKGKGKGPTPGQPSASSPGSDGNMDLLNALSRLVHRAQKKPQGLSQRLQQLVEVAVRDQKLAPKPKRPKKTKDTKNPSRPQIAAPAPEAPWLRVVKGKGVPDHLPASSSQKVPVRFRLRNADWPSSIIIPSVGKLGGILDSAKEDSKFVLLVHTKDELNQALEVIHGDKNAKVTVVVPTAAGKDVKDEDFPNVHFKEHRIPLIDPSGKLVTKVVGIWGDKGVSPNNALRVVVPVDKRPKGPQFDKIRSETLVFRVTFDRRFCDDKSVETAFEPTWY